MFIFELQNKKENKTMAHLTLKQRYEISALFARNIGFPHQNFKVRFM
jgi:hypothetical protein